jgi:rhodanese-related sulfurtransferase
MIFQDLEEGIEPMDVHDFFSEVSEWKPDKVRDFLESKSAGDYNLLDVRQPDEYEQGHLPGAKLIPVAELRDRLHELDPKKPAIAY